TASPLSRHTKYWSGAGGIGMLEFSCMATMLGYQGQQQIRAPALFPLAIDRTDIIPSYSRRPSSATRGFSRTTLLSLISLLRAVGTCEDHRCPRPITKDKSL